MKRLVLAEKPSVGRDIARVLGCKKETHSYIEGNDHIVTDVYKRQVPRAAYVENAAEIKKVVDIPVIAVGRINDVEIAESVLQADKADLVTMARASLIKETN